MSSRVPLRAIIGRFSLGFSRRAIEMVLQECPFAFCADISTGEFPPLAGIPPEHQERFASGEIRGACYAGVDWNTIVPLDEELISQMRECESVFMSAVTRLEPKRTIPHLTRRLWYLRHLQFWNDYLTRRKINLYLSAWVPHEIPDIIIYHLCKLRGIPVLYFGITALRDISFLERDIRHVTPQTEQRYHELLAEHAGDDPARIPLTEPFASYEQSLMSPAGQAPPLEAVYMPSYWQQLRRLCWEQPLALLRHAVRYLTLSGWVRAAKAVYRWSVVRRAERFYHTHASVPDLTCPFVYFPLHYQPEASTLPQGGVFADQILAARLLNATLPEGVLLYIKEHPRKSYWQSRSVQYYEDFLELSKVRLVPKDFDTFQLREHCQAVATITGSAGFEALFRGKPVFVFGSCYYQYARGVYPIRSLRDCREAVAAVFERREKPTHLSTRLFLKAMEETCVRGLPDTWFILISKMSEEEHVLAVGKAIIQELAALQDTIARVTVPA